LLKDDDDELSIEDNTISDIAALKLACSCLLYLPLNKNGA
jgi:hypothetical protein